MGDGPALGLAIKSYRKLRDLTQEELAECVGCHEKTIEKYERGERRPSKQIVALLADCLGIAPEDRNEFVRLARGISDTKEFTESTDKSGHSTGLGSRVGAATHHNLPAALSRLIGRQIEYNAILTFLLRHDVRLVTLTGQAHSLAQQGFRLFRRVGVGGASFGPCLYGQHLVSKACLQASSTVV